MLTAFRLSSFTGQVNTGAIGQDAFQEVDTIGITRPCVKHNFLVKDVRNLAETIKKAFYIAKSGRPGPVVIDLPKDITAAKCEYSYPKDIDIRSYRPISKGHLGQIKKSSSTINQCRKTAYSCWGRRNLCKCQRTAPALCQ